jgi:hypothetical protein
MIRDVHPGSGVFSIPDPGFRGQNSNGSAKLVMASPKIATLKHLYNKSTLYTLSTLLFQLCRIHIRIHMPTFSPKTWIHIKNS